MNAETLHRTWSPMPLGRLGLRGEMQNLADSARLLRLTAEASSYGSDALLLAANAIRICWRGRPDNQAALALAAELEAMAPALAGQAARAPLPADQRPCTWGELLMLAIAARHGLLRRLGPDGAEAVLATLDRLNNTISHPADMPGTLRLKLASIEEAPDAGRALAGSIAETEAQGWRPQGVLLALQRAGFVP